MSHCGEYKVHTKDILLSNLQEWQAMKSENGFNGRNMHQPALKWIVSLLKDHDTPFIICGGLAARGYGSTRTLNDIDLFVPSESFSRVVKAGRNFITKPAAHRCEEGWDLTYAQFKYEGTKVEVGSAEGCRILDAKTGNWVPLVVDFSRYTLVSLLGIELPLMLKQDLINYKTVLSRPVDLDDVQAIR